MWDWEAELAVIIGTTCKDVSEDDALSMVFGYSCLNDVTARDLQRSHVQWFKGKSLDDSCPIGPWIVDAADIGDPQNLEIMLRVNGVEKQHSNTGKMIFTASKSSRISRKGSRSKRATSSRAARPKASASHGRRPNSSRTAT